MMWHHMFETRSYENLFRSILKRARLTLLTQEFGVFFHTHFHKAVTWSDRMEFVSGWYILIVVSDTLTIAGSALKIGIQTKVCLFLLVFARMSHLSHLFHGRLLPPCST